MTDPPKMPHRMAEVHRQVLAHPDYKTRLTDNMRWAYEAGCVSGYSWCTKQNNAWSRRIWAYLYANGPEP